MNGLKSSSRAEAPPSRRGKCWAWLPFAVGALIFAPSAWANLAVTITKQTDGTGTCSLDVGGTNDGKLCTNDQARYKVAYSVNPPPASQTNVVLTLTIPAGEPLKFTAGSPGLSSCTNPSTAISADGRTLSCTLKGAPISNKAEDIFFDITTTSAAKNGDVLSKVDAKITSAENTTGSTSSAGGVTILAQPRADLFKVSDGITNFSVNAPAGCSGTGQGILMQFMVGLNLAELKGSEALADGWSYTDDISQVHPQACLYDVRSNNQASGGTIWPPAASNPSGIDAGAGTYNVTPRGSGVQTITATSGTVTSGEVVGSTRGYNNATALHYIRVWIPKSALTGICQLSGSNVLGNFDPNGISGTSNFGAGTEPTANNTVTFGPLPLCSGTGEKLFTSNTKGISTPLFQSKPRMTNELVGPGDHLDTYITWTNGSINAERHSNCDKWDNRKLRIDLLDPSVHYSGYQNPPSGTNGYYNYQTIPNAFGPLTVDRSPAFVHIYADNGALRTEGNNTSGGQIEFGFIPFSTTPGQTDIDLRSKTCNDGDSTLTGPSVVNGWIRQSDLKNNPSLVPQINAWRIVDIGVNAARGLRIFAHYEVLNKDSGTGPVWADGTVVPNYWSIQSDLNRSATDNTPFTPTTSAANASAWYQPANGFQGNDPLAVNGANSACNTANQGPANPGAYCDNGYSDRVRLVTETVGVRKGVKGTDPTGGPAGDNPVVPQKRGDIVTWQIWPKLTSRSPGVTIPNDLILTDTLPKGMKYVAGSATYSGSALAAANVYNDNADPIATGQTLKFRVPNVDATADGLNIPPLEFQAEVMLDDPANAGGRLLSNSVVIDACAPGAAIGSDGAVTCNAQTAGQPVAERSAKRTVQIAASGALIVQKNVVGGDSKEIGSPFTMELRYLNAGSSAVAEHRLIDVLPYNGEPDRGNPSLAGDATSFNGTHPLQSVTVPAAAGYQVYFTTAAPGSIDLNPKCPSNLGAPGAWPQYAPGVPATAGCTGSNGSTVWTLATQAGANWSGIPTNATAILIKDTVSFPATEPSRAATMTFATLGSRNGDRYSNNFSGANGGPGTGPGAGQQGPGATYNVLSNNVTVRVVAASLAGTVFEDPNRNGAAAGYEPGTDTPLPGVTVTLTKGGTPVGTAVTATAAIPAGQYYNPATGGASAIPGPGLCPVPAGGLGAGQYLFCDLIAGNDYAVVETQPAGYVTTGNKAGTGGGTANAGTDTTSGINLTVGQNATGYDFGEAKAAADMTSAVVCTPTSGKPGTPVSCTVTCTNNGPNAASNATCSVPNAASLPGAPAPMCSGSSSLAAGGTLSCTVKFDLPATGPVTVQGGTGADNDTNGGSAPAAGNNPSSALVTVSPTNADMTSAVVCTPAQGAPGSPVTCTVTCTNAGPDAATNAFCSVPNASNLPGSPTPACTGSPAASLAAGAALSCTVTFDRPASGSVTVQGGTGADNDSNGGADPAAGNNASSTALGGGPVSPIPTLDTRGLIALTLLMLLVGFGLLRRRQDGR